MREESSDNMISQDLFFVTNKDATSQKTITGNAGGNVMNIFPSNTCFTSIKTSLHVVAI